tara:strand:- start:673 stop:1128 length:456 start_codon:yes stop_codon:yes gene_type:complete
MKKRNYKRKKSPVQSKKVTADGIQFASGLEKYMYLALKQAGIPALYEGQTFELIESFDFPFECYERCANGKGVYKNRGNRKILNMKYTPDFVGKGFIIECKGRANESFPLRWKIFKKLMSERRIGPFVLYKPQNQKECDETVKLILQNKNN